LQMPSKSFCWLCKHRGSSSSGQDEKASLHHLLLRTQNGHLTSKVP
jgi:hypothetical protein